MGQQDAITIGEGFNSETFSRMNTHDTTCVNVELCGRLLRLAQNPNTQHLGTTVWDASIVLAKYLEKNARKGELSRAKLHGKRAIELGSGMGLGGMALALLGADVTLSDTADVLGMLRRNCDVNLGVKKVHVCELDWTRPEDAAAQGPPFDVLVAADCVYNETIVPHFHRTVCDLTSPRSTVIIVNELRSHTVQEAFLSHFSKTHTMKRVPASKLHETYQHPLIHVWQCKKKRAHGQAADEEDGQDQDKQQPAAAETQPAEAGLQGQDGSGARLAQGQVQGHGKDGGEQGYPAAVHQAGAAAAGMPVQLGLSGRVAQGDSEGQMQGQSEAQGLLTDTRSGDRSQAREEAPGRHATEQQAPEQEEERRGPNQASVGQQGALQVEADTRSGAVLGQDDWSARRLGVQMAQLLKDVQVPKS